MLGLSGCSGHGADPASQPTESSPGNDNSTQPIPEPFHLSDSGDLTTPTSKTWSFTVLRSNVTYFTATFRATGLGGLEAHTEANLAVTLFGPDYEFIDGSSATLSSATGPTDMIQFSADPGEPVHAGEWSIVMRADGAAALHYDVSVTVEY